MDGIKLQGKCHPTPALTRTHFVIASVAWQSRRSSNGGSSTCVQPHRECHVPRPARDERALLAMTKWVRIRHGPGPGLSFVPTSPLPPGERPGVRAHPWPFDVQLFDVQMKVIMKNPPARLLRNIRTYSRPLPRYGPIDASPLATSIIMTPKALPSRSRSTNHVQEPTILVPAPDIDAGARSLPRRAPPSASLGDPLCQLPA